MPLPKDFVERYVKGIEALNNLYMVFEPIREDINGHSVTSGLREALLGVLGLDGIDVAIKNIPLMNAVFLFSVLEAYVKDWVNETSTKRAIDRWAEEHDIDEETKKKIHELRILRNAILHVGGIDRNALNEFREYGIEGYRLGDRIELNSEKVSEFIKHVKIFLQIN